MATIATKKQGASFDPIPEGAYPARIYSFIHLGTVPGFQGQLQNKVRLTFEFPTEMKVFKEENGEQPMVLSQEYTLSTHEKSQLRKVIDACDPKALKTLGDDGLVDAYDAEQLVGKACLVTVIHKDGKDGAVFANIGSCTVIPKGMECPAQINESKVLSYDNFNQEVFDSLPAFIQDKMKSSLEYKKMTEDPNEIPFDTISLDEIQ